MKEISPFGLTPDDSKRNYEVLLSEFAKERLQAYLERLQLSPRIAGTKLAGIFQSYKVDINELNAEELLKYILMTKEVTYFAETHRYFYLYNPYSNDFYVMNRKTDDGVKAAATDVMARITGAQGEYDQKRQMFVPTGQFKNWLQVIENGTLQFVQMKNISQKPSDISSQTDKPTKPIKEIGLLSVAFAAVVICMNNSQYIKEIAALVACCLGVYTFSKVSSVSHQANLLQERGSPNNNELSRS